MTLTAPWETIVDVYHWIKLKKRAERSLGPILKLVSSSFRCGSGLPSTGLLPDIEFFWTEELVDLGELEMRHLGGLLGPFTWPARLYRCGDRCGQHDALEWMASATALPSTADGDFSA